MKKYLPLIYETEKSIEVVGDTDIFFNANPEIKDKYEKLSWAYQSVGKMIPQTTENFWSGHFFPYMESWDELQISFNLVQFGLYKQAFVSLRSGLELGMLSVYYNINNEGHKTVQDWLKSKDTWEANTPRSNKIWKILNSNDNISEFNKKFRLQDDFNNLSFLHNYVHTKGYKYSNHLGLIKSNHQTYEQKILIEWLNAYEKVIVLVITLHMLKYPISIIEFDWGKKIGIDNPFPVLNSSEIERIKELIPENYFTEIKSIADKDNETQNLLNHIIEIPDMTEDEKEFQIIEFDKSMIEHGEGFIEWEIRELKLTESCNKKLKKKALERIKIIKQWAIENDMMKPKMVRLKEQGFFKNNENT